MKMSKLLTAVLLISFSLTAAATELTPEGRLRKMSLRLRGLTPSVQEINELEVARSEQKLDEFFMRMALAYSHSSSGDVKLMERVMEDLRLPVPSDTYSYAVREASEGRGSLENLPKLNPTLGRSMLFRDLIRWQIQTGKSWSEILTSDVVGRALSISTIQDALKALPSANASRVASFNARAKELGYKLSTENDFKVLLEEYLSNPQKFGNDPSVPRNYDEAFEQLYRVFDGSSARELAFRKQLKLLQKTGKAAFGSQILGVPIYAGFLASAGLNVPVVVNGEVHYEVPALSASSTFTLPIPESKIKAWSCAIQVLVSGSVSDIVKSKCPFVTPYLSNESEISDTETMSKILSGFFLNDGPGQNDFIRKNYNKLSNWNRYRNFGTFAPLSNVPTIFSNPEFNSRYSKTPYSPAAAFFRIAMCDEMKLVAIVDSAKKSQDAFKSLQNILDPIASLSKPSGTSESEGPVVDPHVKGPCMSCHRKLDPARAILGQGQDLKKMEFVYDDAEGREHRVPMNSLEEFPQLVAAQPQFLRCQTEKMWNWVLGEDVQLNRQRRTEIIDTFAKLKTDPRKFVAYLVNLPEFYRDDSALAPAGFQSVRSTLQRCNNCHSGEGLIPSFTDLPINLSGSTEADKHQEHVSYLKDIVKMTKLTGSGEGAKMPPKDAGWSLTDSQRRALLSWVWNLALDDNGRASINSSERDLILSGLSSEKIARVERPTEVTATFRPTWKRFNENFDPIRILLQKLPVDYGSCLQAYSQNQSGIGIKNTSTGTADSDRPTKSFREIYSKCINAGLSNLRVAVNAKPELSEDLAAKMGVLFLLKAGANMNQNWSTLTNVQQETVIQGLMDYYLGRNVLGSAKSQHLHEIISRSVQRYLQAQPNTPLLSVSLAVIYTILNDDEFLTH